MTEPKEAPDLIPASDARLAVAHAYQRAADLCDDERKTYEGLDLMDMASRQTCDEVKAASLALAPADDLAAVKALKRERDSFRAVLEGACYGDIDGIGKNTVEQSRALGEAVMCMTIERGQRVEAAEAEVARLTEALTAIAGFTDMPSVEWRKSYPQLAGALDFERQMQLGPAGALSRFARAALQPATAPIQGDTSDSTGVDG